MFPISPSQVIRISVVCAALACSTLLVAQQTEGPVQEEPAHKVKAPRPPDPTTLAAKPSPSEPTPVSQPARDAREGTTSGANAAIGAATTMTVTPPTAIALALVVDTSHTDRQGQDLLRAMVWRFVRALPEGNPAAIVTTSNKPAVPQDFTDKRDDLIRAVKRLRTGGHPALLAGIQEAVNRLRSSSGERLAVVMFTTGRHVKEPNLEDAIAALRDGKNIEFDAVAGPASDWQLQEQLQRLAVKTNGFALFPPKAGDVSKIAEVAARKLASPGDDFSASNRDRGDSDRRSYTAVVVRHVSVADNPETQEFQSGDDELLQKLLISRLQHEKAFPYVIDGRTEGAKVNVPANRRTLELVTSIVQYRRGNRTQRRFMGYIGGAMVKVNVVLRDLATGRPVQAFMEKGASSSGLFAGSNEEVQSKALKEVTNNIVDNVKKYGAGERH